MIRATHLANAKRPFQGEMALCVAAGGEGRALSSMRRDRYEGDATQPGKAPAR